MFAEIRLREIRCEVEVGRGSCALFAKAKVDARERLEFTEGSTPRERCLSVTTADTRECLEILVFLFLVTLSLFLSLLLSAVFSFSYHFTRAPREPPSRYSTFFVDIPIFEGRVRVGKKEGVGARVTRFASKLRKEAFSSRVGSSFDSYEEESIESKGNYSRPRLGFRNILILGETIRAQRLKEERNSWKGAKRTYRISSRFPTDRLLFRRESWRAVADYSSPSNSGIIWKSRRAVLETRIIG